MEKLTYTNSDGIELELTNSSFFLLEKITDSEGVNIYSSKGMLQDGSSYLGNTLAERDLSIVFTVVAETEEELSDCISTVKRTFNPKLGEGFLTFSDKDKTRKIKCIVNKMPYFENICDVISDGMISLTAHSPYWTDMQESKTEIALWKGDFEFPLEITAAGIEMGHREQSLIVNAFNPGDVPCGIRVELKALATLINPSILNVDTQEYIKINKTMTAGEVITVSTYFGGKTVRETLNGVETNAFNYIDLGSTFLQLSVGDNLMRYDADTGIDNLEVNIYCVPQYLGV